MAVKIRIKDRWAFLEEMEAPMWVDLRLEAKSGYNDTDDPWFYTSHPFHHCSSRQLKAAFAHSGESSGLSDFESVGSSSPKLPSSVSRSRGKEYASKKWRGEDFMSNKQHPVMVLNGTSSSLGSGVEIKPKLSFVNSRGTSSLKSNSASERMPVGNAREEEAKRIPREGVVNRGLNSGVIQRNESSTSTITSESNQQPYQKDHEMSSHYCSGSGELLLALRISSRKYWSTRPASRMEIGIDGKGSRDRKSSSGKSSVGSSSSLSLVSALSKEKYPDCGNAVRMTEAVKNNITLSKMPKASHGPGKDDINIASRGSSSNVSKLTCPDMLKSKVQPHAKALTAKRVNKQVSVGSAAVKEKVKAGVTRRPVIAGKENKTSSMTVGQKGRSGKNSTQTMPTSQIEAKINLPQKGDRQRMVVDPKGKVNGPSKGKHLRYVTQRPHFR